MKKFLYIDCFSGISGDMMVSALLGLGLDIKGLKKSLAKIDISGYQVKSNKKRVSSISANSFNVDVTRKQELRKYRDIQSLINESNLGPRVKKESLEIFEIIAKAESKVHGKEIEEVHFHEIGAIDSIVDIVSAVICINKLNIGKIYSRKIPTGKGFTKSMHGKIPIPAPATLEILKGSPVYGGKFNFEVTTPTGAAIIKKYVEKFCELPQMIIERIGMGAGDREGKDTPNILRLLYGNLIELTGVEQLKLLTTNIDDCTPETIGYVFNKLFKIGVNDAWVENIMMKKNRPGFKLSIICSEDIEDLVVDNIFRETTTFGIRTQKFSRYILDRKTEKVKLPCGEAEVKIGSFKGEVISIEPEYNSCKILAEKSGIPLRKIYQEVRFLLSSK